MWLLYECGLLLGLLLYVPKALWRRRLPHRGWTMRLGRYPRGVTDLLGGRPTLWVHAVSVGEVLAVRPLLQALQAARPQTPLVLSTITPGGFGIASKAMDGRGAAVYFPLDLRVCVRRALRAFRPRLLLLVESELWPAAIRLTRGAGIPVVLVNGRISPRAFRRYRLIRPWLDGLLRQVDLFLMQSQEDADRLVALGAARDRVQVTGSLKWDASLGVRPSAAALQQAAARLGLHGQETLLVGGSTHRGEERWILEAFAAVRASHRDARLILAPRHLERLDEVERLVQRSGHVPVRLSRVAQRLDWDVGLVDTFGELPTYYGLSSLVVIGGSFIPHGGQNPLEASSLGKPVVFGPSMQNFADIAQQLLAHQAARQVAGGPELAAVLQELLANQAKTQAMGRRAQELTERFRGAAQRTLDALQPYLPPAASPG